MDDDFYRKRALKRLGAVAVVLAILAGGFWYANRSDLLKKVVSFESSTLQPAAREISKTFSAPPPLVATTTPSGAPGEPDSAPQPNKYTLTRIGVVNDTNAARVSNGNLPSLVENAALDNIAALRMEDMFAKQYFAHVSPSSSSAETVAVDVGYAYIALGENIALGNFKGDLALVNAWMASPGHRANILDTHYTQIGVSVGKGNFEGSEVWIGVQVFGRPLSDCPSPDTALSAQIDAAEKQISDMENQLKAMRAQMDAMRPQYGDVYNQKVNEYNALVDQYNQLVAQTKTQVAQYNTEVDAYNTCLTS